MLILITAAAAALGFSQEAAGPRNWITGDPELRFVDGTTSPPIKTIGSWSGSVAISVRCTVQVDGSLDACAVISESAPRRLNHRDARASVGRMRLQLGEEGPRPGDTMTVDAVITQHRR